MIAGPYQADIEYNILHSNKMNENNDKRESMLPETKELLDTFYKPYNQELARILNNEKYAFRS